MPGFVRVLRNDLAEVSRMVDRFGAFARSNDLSDALRQQMAVAFDEVVANIVTYGYDDDAEHHIAVRVDLDEGVLVVTVEDDGIGIPADRQNPAGLHGLKSMRHRVRSLGGQLIIGPGTNHGTRVLIAIPLAEIVEPDVANA